ncbi:MAG: amidohydrolase [Candidatus Hydrogenedentes bacterium]|nr:amidohydrolase [Candidatus Hydrogenedentota bacterium]
MDIIDVWMQHPTKRFMEQPFLESLRRWVGAEQLPETIPLEMTLAAMDAGGVSQGLLAAWYGPQGALISNEEVAAWCRAHPDRFVGLASGDLHRPMEAVRALRQAVKEWGFKGLRMVPWLWGLPPDDRRYYPLYAECVDLGVPFCTQVGHTGPLCTSETGRPIPYLENVALEFPELTIVAGHIGAPWLSEMLLLARKFPNVYIDTSAYKIKRYPQELVDYMKQGGAKKVLFGTNYPMVSPAQSLADLESMGLDEKGKRLFLCENAQRVFKLGQIHQPGSEVRSSR